jgi:hypothetical protein
MSFQIRVDEIAGPRLENLLESSGVTRPTHAWCRPLSQLYSVTLLLILAVRSAWLYAATASASSLSDR